MMCPHREHRTGNCGICHPIVPRPTPPQSTDSNASDAAMPLLWEGDQA